MKRLICLFLSVIILVCIAGNAWMDAGRFLSEQQPTKKQDAVVDAAALDALREYNGGSVPDISVREDGVPYIIHGAYSDRKVTDEVSAVESMADLSDLMNFSGTKDSFETTQVNRVDNNVYYRLQRCYGQYPVYGQEFVVTTDAEGNILSLSSGYVPITDCTDKILITEEQAKTIATEHCGNSFDKGTLMFYLPEGSSSARLAWQFSGLDVVFVDAGTGEVLTSFPAIYIAYYEATGVGIPDEDIYREVAINLARDDHDTEDTSDDTYLFYDYSRNIYYYDAQGIVLLNNANYRESCTLLTGTDTIFGDSQTGEKKAVNLYEKLSIVYDFYKEHVGITSYDNKGSLIVALVNENYNNGYDAYNWGPFVSYDEMTTFLGFGSNRPYHKQIDVIGHEFTHAVQRASVPSGLSYEGENGALMEAYSDVMGELIELHSTGSANWYLSNLRNIADPHDSGDPQTYKDEKWYTGTNNGDYVHQNSTVVSHALYKMYSRGLCSAEDMAKFLYKAWQHMTSKGDFRHYHNCLLLAASEMRMNKEQLAIIITALEEAGITDDRSVHVTFELRDGTTNGNLKHKDGSLVSEVEINLFSHYNNSGVEQELSVEEPTTYVVLNSSDGGRSVFEKDLLYGVWELEINAKDYKPQKLQLVIDDKFDKAVQTVDLIPAYYPQDQIPIILPTEDQTSEEIPRTVSDEVYLEYLKTGAYRLFFRDDSDKAIYSYALLDIDQDRAKELLIQQDLDQLQPINPSLGWSKLLIVKFDSKTKEFQPISWGDSQDTTYVMNGGIYHSTEHKSLVFSPSIATNSMRKMEYWHMDQDQMKDVLYVWRDVTGTPGKYWIEMPRDNEKKGITEAEHNSYMDQLSSIVLEPMPKASEAATATTVQFEYKDLWNEGNDREYGVFVAREKSGKELWRYTTVDHVHTELRGFGEIGIANGAYYLYDDDNVITLDLQTGEEIWRCPFIGGNAAFDFDDTGTLYICGHYGPDLAVIDKEGKLMKQIDSFDTNYYWADQINCQQDKVVVKLSGGPDGYKEKGYICTVYLPDYSYQIVK